MELLLSLRQRSLCTVRLRDSAAEQRILPMSTCAISCVSVCYSASPILPADCRRSSVEVAELYRRPSRMAISMRPPIILMRVDGLGTRGMCGEGDSWGNTRREACQLSRDLDNQGCPVLGIDVDQDESSSCVLLDAA